MQPETSTKCTFYFHFTSRYFKLIAAPVFADGNANDNSNISCLPTRKHLHLLTKQLLLLSVEIY